MTRCPICKTPKNKWADSDCHLCVVNSIARDVGKKTKDVVRRLKESRARAKRMAERRKK